MRLRWSASRPPWIPARKRSWSQSPGRRRQSRREAVSGLAGEEIPLGARIIHVADALDSMLTTRIYRAARPADEALEELRRGSGSQFCPRCVTALERLLHTEDEGEPEPPSKLIATA